MDKKILVVLLFLVSFGKAQIFTETFNSFTPDTIIGQFFLTQDTIPLTNWGYANSDWVTDIIDSKDFTANNDITETAGSILSKTGGTHRVFGGSSDYMNLNDNGLNPGTNDFTVQTWIKTSADITSNGYIANKREGAPASNLGWQLNVYNDSLRAVILDGGSTLRAVVAVAINTWYYAAATWDRDGNCILRVYSSGGLVADTVDISSLSASNLNPSTHYVMGAYSKTVTADEWDGGLAAIKWSSAAVRTNQELTEDAFLAENWKSGGGAVYRNAFGWAQGVLNTGGNPISVGTKGGTTSAISTITGDSARYTVQIAGITSLSSDSLIIVAGGDSVWHPLSDSTFTAGRGLQVVLDVWSLTNLNPPVGTYAYIDNITVSTYLITSAATTTTTSEFQKYNKYSDFDGF